MYSEFGGKPHTWDQSQKGSVKLSSNNEEIDDDDNLKGVIVFMGSSVKFHRYVRLSWAEYVFVSLSLSLVIAKFFPAVHNQIVSRATRLEHQSLYWGTAVVSNIFTYGLLFAGVRGMVIFSQALYLEDILHPQLLKRNELMIVPSVVEVIVNVILFVGALIASLRTKSSNEIPIPGGMGKILFNISFLWSCACCCVCSQRCKVKLMRILIMFSFMMFVHRSIMDAISFVFMLFIEQSRAVVVTVALLYTSSVVFLIVSVSFSFFILRHGSNAGMSIIQKLVNFAGGVCMLISVFGAVALMVVMYMIIVFSLNLKGVAGILIGLIPSIALSAGTFYIKTKLLKRALGQTRQDHASPGAHDKCINDRGKNVTNDETMLLP